MPTDLLFVELSEALTGVEHLPADLAAEYDTRLRAEGMAAALDRLQAVYQGLKDQGRLDHESLTTHLFADADLKHVAEQLIVLWYSSALMEIDAKGQVELIFGKPEHHFQALLWDVIGAHPPALSGGYFGYWHYPPEN
jgi:hypothetical protein